MPINADKPHLWKTDVQRSVDMFNTWFVQYAPETFQESRKEATGHVASALLHADDLRRLTPETLSANTASIQTFRMCTAPPLARDRLSGLANVSRSLIKRLEDGELPRRSRDSRFQDELASICEILMRLLDRDVFGWLNEERQPTEAERLRASTIVADRLTGAISDPLIRNAQEQRQLALIEQFLTEHGYRRQAHPGNLSPTEMEPGTFTFRMNIFVKPGKEGKIPIDAVIQPKIPRTDLFPILIEAKSAGDYANPNKRRKEESDKIHKIHARYGADVQLILFLCGYFDTGYLGYEAAEGIDWVWEHRVDELFQLGI